MKQNLIVTIGRQYGSGGRDIGMKLAKKLGVPYYDKELIGLVASKNDLSVDVLKQIDEVGPSRFAYTPLYPRISFATGLHSIYNMPITDRVFVEQLNVIRELAEKSSCVIVGRCADYVLRENPNCINVFIHADMAFRAARKKDLEKEIKEKTIEDYIRKIDKSRAKYYNFYTTKKWGESTSYHISLSSSAIGIDAAADLLYDFVKIKEKYNNISE